MSRTFVIGLAIGLYALLAAPTAPAAPTKKKAKPKANAADFLIVPGQALGHIQIGMKRDLVIKALGQPTGTYHPPDPDYADYWVAKKGGSTVRIFYEVDKVTQISVTSPSFHTADGLSVASQRADFEAKHADAKALAFAADHGVEGTYLDDQKAGIAFEITMQGDGDRRAPKGYALLVHASGRPVGMEPDEKATGDATAKDDCTFDAHAGGAILDQGSHKLSKYLGAKDVPYDFSESAVLLDGTTVTYEMGGCAHMGYGFTYQGFPAVTATDAPTLIDLAQHLLDATPETSDSQQRKAFLEALGKARKAPPAPKNGVIELPCDDPRTCELEMQAGGKLSLTLDSGL